MLEETGIALSLDACRSLGTIYPDTGVLTTEVLFCAELPSGLDLTAGANEIQSTMWVPIDAVLMNIIKDNYTVSAVMKARLLFLI